MWRFKIVSSMFSNRSNAKVEVAGKPRIFFIKQVPEPIASSKSFRPIHHLLLEDLKIIIMYVILKSSTSN